MDISIAMNDAALHRWIRIQNQEYKALRSGERNIMYEEKISRLRGIGFVFSLDLDEAEGSNGTKNKRRTIYKQWGDSLVKLKSYMDAHDGEWKIHTSDEENTKVRLWVQDQRLEYRRLRNGQVSRMTEEKLARLKDIGVGFTYTSWEDRMKQLKAFKLEHGHLNVPIRHEVLGNFFSSMRRKCRDLREGKAVRDLSAAQVDELKSLGFKHDLAPGKSYKTSIEEYNKEFEEMMAALVEYKQEYGDCLVKRSYKADPHLHGWILRQRVEFKKLNEKNPSRMTVQQLIRLTKVGFAFVQKGGYQTFEMRLEGMKQFKAEHGHINIPVSNEELGDFVVRQRKHYRLLKMGRPSAMTEERIESLEQLGFEWNTDKWKDTKEWEDPVSWDERFQELLDFKAAHGHTIVPQSTPGLGTWVNRQRYFFKNMKQGKKRRLTTEKALKLSGIGFVVDVFALRRDRKKLEHDEHSKEIKATSPFQQERPLISKRSTNN